MATLPNSNTVTYEEWLRMPVVEDAIEEVVQGEIPIMPPVKWKHALIIVRLQRPFEAQLDIRKYLVVTTQFGFLLKPRHFPNVQINISEIWPD